MKNKIQLSFLFLLAFLCSIQSVAQVEYFININPLNGAITRVDSISGVQITGGLGRSAIDKVNNRYYFVGENGSAQKRLYMINTLNGAVLNSPVFPQSSSPYGGFALFAFDESSGSIVTASWNSTVNKEFFLKIDPLTGYTISATFIPGLASMYSAATAFDQNNKRYIFAGIDSTGINRLYTINAINGTVISKPPISLGINFPLDLSYNNITNKLIGVVGLNGSANSPAHVVEIDAATGLSTTTITTFQNVAGIYGTESSLDEINNRYTVHILIPMPTLITVNLSNGSTVASPVFPVGLAPGEYVRGWLYNNSTGILHGRHWGARGTTHTGSTTAVSEVTSDADVDITVYPNPLVNTSIVKLNKAGNHGMLLLSNDAGVIVRKTSIANIQNVEIKKENLPSGVYFLSIVQDGSVRTRKIVIE